MHLKLRLWNRAVPLLSFAMGSLGGAPCHLQAHGGVQQTSVRKSHKRHGARRPRVVASSAVASDVAPAQVGQPVTVAPDDLRLQDGEVSHVVAEPSSSPADVFRCTGCTAEECQVRMHRTAVTLVCKGHQTLTSHAFGQPLHFTKNTQVWVLSPTMCRLLCRPRLGVPRRCGGLRMVATCGTS